MTRAAKIELIYRTTHSDFRMTFSGRKAVMADSPRGATFRFLDDMSDTDLAELLPYAQRKAARDLHAH
jgi:hypothetical protein